MNWENLCRLSISVDMQKMIIDPVVNKVNMDSLVRGGPYDKKNLMILELMPYRACYPIFLIGLFCSSKC
uniref:50S ribosomal protein L22 n=1 Tax=Handeliodendron bodinieri TaxID=290952 RepID=A0A7S8FI90_9ROSI|nr:50S ribosomal protein L22 [Handeliodendron bodinieri]QPD06565.1 50S ribosomal protein L22 [Handeliodendron bodinieri]